LLYLRYSKCRYLKFYRAFSAFRDEVLSARSPDVLGLLGQRCIIDNTNLARLRGSGRQAVIVPEMVAFAERYGFQFVCHELQHCDRKPVKKEVLDR